ncbi:hypothetical protein KIV35_22030 [Enterobacter roggenkampii]|uniref:hypothetical protein n=1 Tax=Enterobacter roggenkampii TaxID=1812935 RepID=UPI000F83F674|nr:hypothetical protein [Enterobacter roggenkampii]MBS7802635.1 hypothetical protein [Enterobacter roggenkampii]MCK7119544.1 hypothetical protein [Enterobacter roggenkampii]MDK9941059.1 hypothetical protein [Enterobacter roggenkampii]MDK9945432.1 hypothetical protein [Enterobacter roggenkampii]RTP15873.1 hypothetical protein EKN52_20905 [Enterobacter roggenkampii]
MKLKSFIAKITVIAILSGIVFSGARFLYNDNQKSQYAIASMFNPDHRTKDYPGNEPARGWMITGSICYKNDMAFLYPDFDTKAECEKRANEYNREIDPLISEGNIYGRTMLGSGAVLFLSLASIVCSLAFVGLRKLWRI